MTKNPDMVWGLPRPIWIISVVGLLINLSTSMVFSLMPTFMEMELGASKTTIGRMDGFVEFVSYIIRIFSGFIADVFQNRKVVLGTGYALSALVKPLFAIAGSVMWMFWVRVLDRLSNGIQASPRDALIGNISPKKTRGASYGLTKSLKTAGSCLGALLAMWVMLKSSNDYRLLFLVAFVPALFAVILLVLGVKEPRAKKKDQATKRKIDFKWSTFLELGRGYWKIILLAIIFQLAHFGESYLVFRVSDTGLNPSYIPMVMLLFNMGQFSVAYPMGRLSDMISRRVVLMVGFLFMAAASLIIGYTSNLYFMMTGIFLWGAQMGATQSIFVSLISDTAPQCVRGTAFGIFYVACGLCIFVSSWVAGDILPRYGYETLFSMSSAISIISCFFIFMLVPKALERKH